MARQRRAPGRPDRPPRPIRIRWTSGALNDLADIGEYMAMGAEQTAARWVTRLSDAPDRPQTMPLSGRIVPEIASPDTREVIVGQYRLIYRVTAEGLVILGIASGKKQLPARLWPPKGDMHCRRTREATLFGALRGRRGYRKAVASPFTICHIH